MEEGEILKDIPKESRNIKSYKKSCKATKKTNKTQNQIKNNKTNKIQNEKNKVVGYPDGKGKKNEMPSHPLNGPDDHIHSFETEEQKAGVIGIKKKCPSSECSKPKTGVHSNPSVTKVGPSLMDEDEEIPDGWKQDLPDGWKTDLQEGGMDDDTNYSDRLETKLDQLRMKWAKTGYEIIIEKLEMLESWQR